MIYWARAVGADHSAFSPGKNKATGFHPPFSTDHDVMTTGGPVIALFNQNTSAL